MVDNNLRKILELIVVDLPLHAKWLNTLSLMENTGARKISKYEHPVYTNLIELKHAAEEARHAYYLKKQINKLIGFDCPDYSFPFLISPQYSYYYLNQLDISVCRNLKNTLNLKGRELKQGAYLFVTYSIEVRADKLYSIYQEVLTENNSPVSVKSIIAEEEGHLEEMTKMLTTFHPQWKEKADEICAIENKLFELWIEDINKTLNII